MNSYSTLHTFSAFAPESSLMFDHVTRRLGPEPNPRKQVESSSAVYTLTTYQSTLRLAWWRSYSGFTNETARDCGDGDATTRATVCDATVPSYDAHAEGTTEDREESWKQRSRSLQTVVLGLRNFRPGGQHGTIRADYGLHVWFQDRGRGRTFERISGVGETIRGGERDRSCSRPRHASFGTRQNH